jgi:protein-S-isoprenylcysteine O-methyltransferase Ste14
MNDNQKDNANINRYIHPPIVALFYIAISYLLGLSLPLPFTAPGILRTIGFIVTVIGFLFGVGAVIEFRKARTTLDPHGTVSTVVSTGIYRFTRNPIYFGFLCLLIGLPLYSGYYWGAVLAPFFVLTMNRLVIEKEEAYLEKKFGEGYANYKSRVRRWL